MALVKIIWKPKNPVYKYWLRGLYHRVPEIRQPDDESARALLFEKYPDQVYRIERWDEVSETYVLVYPRYKPALILLRRKGQRGR